MPGLASDTSLAALAIRRNASVSPPPMRTVPRTFLSDDSSALAISARSSISSALLRSMTPSSVSSILRLLRTNNVTPSSLSRAEI